MQTFHLRRYFSITSGIAVLVASLLLSWTYYRHEVSDQVEAAQARNVVLAQTFANAIWPVDEKTPTEALHRRLLAMSRDVPVVKIKIYNARGTAFYSSVPAEIGEDKSANPGFREALAGRAVSELTHRGSMSVTEGRIENVDVVSTYIPIRNGHIDAVFELYSDVTDALAAIQHAVARLLVFLALVFGALYGILLYIVTRADRILQAQYGALEASAAALRASEEKAAAANKAKTEFLSSMSHELRTPMNAILGFAQLLQTEPAAPLNANQHRFVEQILKAGRHLLELINEVLDLARIEAGKLVLSVEPVSVAQVLAECLPLIHTLARERQVSVAQAASRERLRVMADYVRLKQALLNLLSNAVKYNRPGGTVSVEVARRGAGVRIAVVDTGIGIPREMQAELFQPFQRLAQNAPEVEGTGIGLALTKKLVDAMGGTIGFESAWGSGSTFWVELPAAAEEAQQVAPGEAPARAAQPALRRTVLYVEDNPANVLLMEQIASRMGLRFVNAHNGELGIALAASEKPDLIFMDINLPQMDGYEALRNLKQNPETASIPVVAITANAMGRDVARGLAAGFVRYATKPIVVDEIMRMIGELLEVDAVSAAP